MNSPITLFCIPYAGGTKQSFNQFLQHFSNLNVVVLELPGKGTRYGEPRIDDLNALVEDVYLQIKREPLHQYFFWGHSMGALLAFLVTRRIAEDQLTLPGHLFLSGRAAPATQRKVMKHLLPREAFFDMLIKMGGIPKEIAGDRDLLEFFEAMIRADFKAVETFEYVPARPLSVPLTIMIGSDEEFSYEEALDWKSETSAGCEIVTFPGGHFFIYDHVEKITELIKSAGLLIQSKI